MHPSLVKVLKFMSRRIPRWAAKYAVNRAVKKLRKKYAAKKKGQA